MRAWILVQFFVFVVALRAVNASEHHVVYMPKLARIDSNYTIFFLSIETRLPTNVSIYVNNVMKNFHVVEPGHPTLLMTHILEVGNSTVKLVAKGGSTFVKETVVRTIGARNKAAIFVQKSKYHYEPGQLLRFNCFAMDSEFMVIRKPIDIEVYDSKKILIQKWSNQIGNLGVVTQAMHISNDANRGFWKLVIKQNETKLSETEYFLVKSTESSRATVEITGSYSVFSLGLRPEQYGQQTVQLVIRAYYACTLPMIGRVTIVCLTNTNDIYKMSASINGTYVFEFRLDRFLKPPYRERKFEFYAIVEDMSTNFYVVSQQHVIRLHTYPVTVIRPYVLVQKEGLHQTVALAVRPLYRMHYLSPSESQGSLNVTFVNPHTRTWSVHCATLVGTVVVPIPLSNLTNVIVRYTSRYQQFHYTVSSLIKVQQFTPGYPQMEVYTCSQNYYAGDIIHIQINATVKVKAVYYMVMHEGCIISAGRVFVYGDRVIVGIKTEFSWNPFVKIIFTAVTYTEYTLVNGLLVNLMPNFAYNVEAHYAANIIQSRSKSSILFTAEKHSILHTVSSADKFGKDENKFLSMEMIIAKLYNWYFPTCSPVYINVMSIFKYAMLDYSTNMFRVPKLIPGHYFPCYRDYVGLNTNKPANRRDPFNDVMFFLTTRFRAYTKRLLFIYGADNEADYYVHAFAVHRSKGLSVMKKKHPIKNVPTVWHCFSVPRSVFLGEEFNITIVVYNYLPYSLLVNVKVVDRTLIRNKRNIKTVMVPCKTYVYVTFSLYMTRFGSNIIFTEVYSGRKVFDTYSRKIYVRHHGYMIRKTNEKRLNLKIPTNYMKVPVAMHPTVPGSEETFLYYSGDIMATILYYMPSIVLQPTDSCEQRVSKLSFCVFTNQYITFLQKNAYNWKLIRSKRFGYQSVQKCHESSGSYDRSSVWVTAMACRNIYLASQGKNSIAVDEEKLSSSVNWLINQQRSDGSYAEIGSIIHQLVQLRRGKTSTPLTIYVLLALIDLQPLNPIYVRRAISKGKRLLWNHARNRRWDTFSLTYMAHLTAKLGEKRMFRSAYNVLKRRATRTRRKLYWKGDAALEQTCHVLLGMYYMKWRRRGVKVLNYVLSQRNMRGGFPNAQSTAVCVEACAKFGQYLIRVSNAKVNINIGNSINMIRIKYINGRFPLRLYSRLYPAGSRGAQAKYMKFTNKIWKEPRQYGIARVVRSYSTLQEINDGFDLVKTIKAKKGAHLDIEICYEWRGKSESGLLLTRLQLPTGYVKKEVFCGKKICGIHDICTPNHICFTNVVGKESQISIYLISMYPRMKFCLTVRASEFFKVKNRKIKMYAGTWQYYTDKKIILFYDA